MYSSKDTTPAGSTTVHINKVQQPLCFEITSYHIVEKGDKENRHVLYCLNVRHISGIDDPNPSVIERRYTHFYNLYTALRKEHPQLMQSVTFPKKVLIGNFDNKLINFRSTGFESLLQHISTEPKLRTSGAQLAFLQDTELCKIKRLLGAQNFSAAAPVLEGQFKLLNKVYTDRSPAVLLALCRLLGCCVSMPGAPDAAKWADLVLHRYEGVSDSDLLELYLPLLHICTKVWWQIGRDKDVLVSRFEELRKQGLKFNESLSFLDNVGIVKSKVFDL